MIAYAYRWNLVLIALVAVSFPRLHAQENSDVISRETLALIRQAPKAKGEESGALILLRERVLTIDEKGRTTEVLHIIGKVYDRSARLDYAQISVPVNSYLEDVTLDYARTIRDDGSIRNVSKDAIQEKTTPDGLSGVLYTDTRFLTFALSGLDVGVAFEFQITAKQKIPAMKGEWFDEHSFSYVLRNLSPPYSPRLDPVLTSRYTLRVLAGTTFQYHCSADTVQPMKSTSGKWDEYCWEIRDVPAIKLEDSMPPLDELVPTVMISSLRDWKQIDNWANEQFFRAVETTHDIVEQARTLTSGCSTDVERIKSIFHFIQNQIQYVYADLGRGGYVPHPASEVLKSRYGDCKDQAILFISLLKAIGIEAYPALTTPAPSPERVEIPTIFFSHLITYIPRPAGDLWLDTTPGVTQFPRLFYPNQNRWALIVNGRGGKLVKTPGSNAEDNNGTYEVQAYFDNNKARMTLLLSAHGAIGDNLKTTLGQFKAEQQQEILQSFIKSKYKEAVIDSVGISDLRDPDVPFHASFKFHIDSVWERSMEFFHFGSNTFFAMSTFLNAPALTSSDKRHYDLVSSFLLTINGSERYFPPSHSLTPTALPANDSLNSTFFSFHRYFARHGDAVEVSWSLTSKEMRVTRKECQRFSEELKSILERTEWTVRYWNPEKMRAEIAADRSSEATVRYCTAILDTNSTNIAILFARALSYDRLRKHKAAVTDFEKILKLEPENKFAHLWIAGPLMGLSKRKEAMAHLDSALTLDSAFVDALLARGAARMGNNDLEGGLADYKSAVDLDSRNAFLMASYGEALGRLNRYNESLDAFQRALTIDSMRSFTYEDIADTYYAIKSYDNAVAAYRRAIKLNPFSSHAHGNLGWIYYLKNNDKKCIEYSRKAVELDPMAYYARYNIALATLRSGNFREARKLYEDLRGPMRSVREANPEGAIKDLNDLIAKGIKASQATFILRDVFEVNPVRK